MHKQLQIRQESHTDSQFIEASERSIRFQQISYEDSEERLRCLKNQVQLNRSQLNQILQNESYETEAMNLNKQGMELIKDGQVTEATIFISQAQKILEYAANSGKEINRMLIVSVLHNLACCHQQTWSLEKCSNYVQALIYNLNCEIKHITDNENQSRLIAVEEVVINRQLAQYYLLFCAINSQLKRNDAALIAAKKGSYLLKNSSYALARLAQKSRLITDIHAIEILNDLSRIKTSTEDMNAEEMIEIANYFMYVWKNKCSFPNIQFKNIIQKLKDFSIGNVMQIEPRGIQLFDKIVWNELTLQNVMERVVFVAMSFFTMATQLRLLAIKMSNGCKQKAREMSEFRQSQCYHLISIILLFYYLPFDLLFLQHILTSFSSHYLITIQPRFSNNNPKKLFSTLLQQEQKDEIKRSTAFNSDKDHSSGPSRNSFQDAKNSYLKLQSDVRASLKDQNYDHNKDMDKLNSYYYTKQQNCPIRLKSNRKSHQSIKKNIIKRACATSKQSAQKTPAKFSPSQLSPKKSKNFQKGSKSGLSSKNNSIHKCISPQYAKKMSNIIDQYFNTQLKSNRQSKRKGTRSKSKKSKQNLESKGRLESASNLFWKANNLTNRQQSQGRSKQKNQLKGLKSPRKLKSKLESNKSKKKLSKSPNYH